LQSTAETVRIIGTRTIRATEEEGELVLTDVILPVGSAIISEQLVVEKTLEVTRRATLAAADVIRFSDGVTLVLKEESPQLLRCDLGNVSLIRFIPTIDVNVQGSERAASRADSWKGFIVSC
jgi:hypothetical protein